MFEEALYSIALRHCPLIGDVNFKKLIEKVGSAKDIWEISKVNLNKIDGIGHKTTYEIGDPKHLKFAEKEMAFCEKNNIQIKLRHLGHLPKLLNDCHDTPAIVYQKGKIDHHRKFLSIVGTRKMSYYGQAFIQELHTKLKDKNVTTVSGLALGVDAAVHEHSIKNNIPTIAVLAHGLHTLYPSKNRHLAEEILANQGALITEFNSSQKPDRENFIQRNRIVAGMSSAVVIVETAFGGGSVSTATFANSYNREVFALPGKITDKYSQGCNHLIYQNKAATISTIPNLLDQLGVNQLEGTPQLFPKKDLSAHLTPPQKLIYTLIEKNPKIGLDELSQKTEWSTHKILPILLELEISGFIQSFSGRQFCTLEN